VAGAIPGGGGVVGKVGAKALMTTVRQGAVSGAAGGSMSGAYGYARQPGPHSVAGFVGHTALGGAAGAGMGAAGGAAGHGLAAVGGRVLSKVHSTPLNPIPDVPVATKPGTDLVRYDPHFASRTLLNQMGDGYGVTPGGRTVTAHAAERIALGGGGRAPTTLERVDDILDNPTKLKYNSSNDTVKVFQDKAYVAVRGTGPVQHIVTAMVP
jgi:hypothetical protein